MSSPIQCLELVWKESQKSPMFSYRRLNGSMQDALNLAISSGMKFDPEDFQVISKEFGFGYWGGNSNGGFAETWYARAVMHGNLSAARSFEKWKKREPFITFNVWLGRVHRKRDRLAVGSEIMWKGLHVRVTSFADDGSYLVATLSIPSEEADVLRALSRKETSHRAKVVKRLRITRKDLKE